MFFLTVPVICPSLSHLLCMHACCAVGCYAGGKGKAVSGSVIRATIPYVKADIPILVLFRALGTVVSEAWWFWLEARRQEPFWMVDRTQNTVGVTAS